MLEKLKNGYSSRIFAIALPIMLSNIISQVQMLIDKMFLGRLDMIYMSAVGNASSPMWTCMSVIFSVTIGATILVSQAIGRGDKKAAYEMTCAMFKYSSVISFIMFIVWFFFPRFIFGLMNVPDDVIDYCVTYASIYAPVFLTIGLCASLMSMMQTAERTQYLLVYGIIRSLLNVFLDYALIFGNFGLPKMGIAGAALATTIAEFAGQIFSFGMIIFDKHFEYKPKFSDVLKASFKPYVESVKMGAPTALEDFAWNFGNLMIIVSLNHVSSIAAGVFNLVFSIELIPVCVFGGLGNAALTISGQKVGEGKYREISRIVKTGIFWSYVVAVCLLILFVTKSEFIVSMFTTDPVIIEASAVYLMIMGINMFPKSANIIIGNGIRGYGDTKWMLFTQLFGTVFVSASAFTLVYGFNQGVGALLVAVICDETLRTSMNLAHLKKITKSH